MTFDPALWAEVTDVLGLEDGRSPADLDRDHRAELADRLRRAGWSYRSISSALGVPTTTLHRLLHRGDSSEATEQSATRGLWPWITVATIVGAFVVVVRKGRPPM